MYDGIKGQFLIFPCNAGSYKKHIGIDGNFHLNQWDK